MIHSITNSPLTLDKVEEIITLHAQLRLDKSAAERIAACRRYLDRATLHSEAPIYGVTTGFGSLCNISIGNDELSRLQENLIMSHACGTGDRVPAPIVRLMLLMKIQSLAYGHSGVQVETIGRLIDFFNHDILPVVFEQGSLGASGDLAPLAHLSLPLIGMGRVVYRGREVDAVEMLEAEGWQPIRLQSKEGLALLNGTQFMSAYGAYCLIQAKRLSRRADEIAALSLEAFDGRIEPFLPQVHAIRAHAGQQQTAARMRNILEGSRLIQRTKTHVQDPYSFRCIPQVHGASKDTIHYVEGVFNTEMSSATDNPTIFPDDDLVISAGNFHGQPIALAMDFLAIALAELGNISERRTYQLLSGRRELPSYLVAKPGLNSGFMIPQYTAASIVSQTKGLCMPASVDSIPSSQGQEDHVSMGSNAATKLLRVVRNVERVLAIELMTAAQALEFRGPDETSPTLHRLFQEYRRVVPFVDADRTLYPLIEQSIQFLHNEATH